MYASGSLGLPGLHPRVAGLRWRATAAGPAPGAGAAEMPQVSGGGRGGGYEPLDSEGEAVSHES